ncbi:MAG: hypothetical protein II866_14345 [Prevotella sp.]|jgi:hypothetical protein|nr:hypothetical protein [Prevotella sp.]
MKEMTIRVSDELAELVERWTEHTPEMEVIDTSDCLGDDERDLCFKQAIVELIEEGVIRRPRDYAWIMAAIDQDVVSEYECFNSSQAFIDYMEIVGITKLPDRTTLFRAYNLIDGEYPNWSFLDDPDDKEILRRNNVVVRFKSAFYRAKRGRRNSLCNKCS